MDPQNRTLAYLRLNQKLGAGILKSAVITASFQHNEEGQSTSQKRIIHLTHRE